jgi:hypothetical protein
MFTAPIVLNAKSISPLLVVVSFFLLLGPLPRSRFEVVIYLTKHFPILVLQGITENARNFSIEFDQQYAAKSPAWFLRSSSNAPSDQYGAKLQVV